MASTNQPSKKSLRNPGGSGEASQQGGHNGEKSIKFARRTSSGRYVNLSKEDIEMSSDVSADYMNYTVHIPSTPDNQPMDSTSVAMKAEEQYVSNSLFTGGFNSVTRAHLMDKVIDSEVKHPQMAGSKGSSCSICDGKVMKDERGNDVTPCECRYKICRDCFIDAQNDSGMCPGCKEPYKVGDYEDDNPDYENGALPLLTANGSKQSTNNMSVMKRNQNGEFDHNKWLFETKGTYGVGNAYWPPDAEDDRNDGLYGGGGGGVFDASEKPWKPLCRKRPIPSGVLSPYRLIFGVRFIVMCLFLHWRVAHPNKEAIWLWAMSITCEIWFAFSWILEQIPKLYPINRSTDLAVLHEKFDSPSPSNPTGKSDLPGVDLFVSTSDPDNEPPLVTANTILSILAVDYPVEKLACYVSDDGGVLLTFETLAEAASFADLWVPFCRKHNIEPRNPESYFSLKVDPTKNKSKLDFVKDRRRVKREYDEFKVRINSLSDSIRRRSDAFNAREEMKMMKHFKESGADPSEPIKKVLKATWMADGTHWPGTWASSSSEHSQDDHAGILQVMLKPPSPDSLMGSANDKIIDFSEVDTRLPMLVYVAREKRPAYDHNKKAGAMNALVRASAILSNGPFILNLDCDHYIYNCKAIREGMCFMMDRGGEDICYIQFPQRFESIDPSDRYANHSTVFFDANMRALDGLQGPFYMGTGCMFRRFALYGFDPPLGNWEKKNAKKSSELDPSTGKRDKNNAKKSSRFGRFLGNREKKNAKNSSGFDPPSDNWEKENAKSTQESIDEEDSETTPILKASQFDQDLDVHLLPKRFGNSLVLTKSIPVAELQGRPLADNTSIKYGREPGTLRTPREPLEAGAVAEAVSVISCWYEDKTEWGDRVGWIYGSMTEDVVTGYRMHNRGWRSVYCVTKRDAFRGSAPTNLTDLLLQVLRSATGSVEIFLSKNNAIFGSKRLKLVQRLAYLNFGIYPFTSIFLIVYCFLPALSLFSGFFIVQTFTFAFLIYLLTMTVCVIALAILEMKWSGVELEQWWRNEQLWLVSGISAHLAAVIQGLLKVVADLYIVKWSSLIIPPIVIAMVNVIAIAVAISRTIYSASPQWSKFIAGAFFSFWVLAHLYPFAKGLMGTRGKTPTIVYVWSGLIAITISLLWIAISSPLGAGGGGAGGDFTFP